MTISIPNRELSAEFRSGVIADLPELQLIADQDLREKVTDAWVIALAQSSFRRIRRFRARPRPARSCSSTAARTCTCVG
ncbi:hypothetical protein ACVDG5_019350 [Mesorhizobium sp. ORM6]